MRIKLSKLVQLAIFVFVVVFMVTNAVAYNHSTYAKYFYDNCQYYDYQMIGGIESGYWTYYPTSNTDYQTPITNAISAWSGSGASFSRVNYNSNYSCKLNFALGNYGSGWGRGKTNFYSSSNTLINGGGEPTSNWKYVIIQINKDELDSASSNGTLGTITHEVGHSFGLTHFNTSSASTSGIMHSTHSIRYVAWGIYQPKSFEINAVKDYYGN